MTTILDPALDLSIAPLTNTPLTSTDTTFELADQVGDITNFPDPGALGYFAWVWAREPNFPNVGDANRAGVAERVRVTTRDVGLQTLTVTRGASPFDLNASGVTYWLVAPMNAKYVDDIDDRLFNFVAGNLVTTKNVQVPTLFAEQIDLAVTTPGVGSLRFLEDTANGTSAVTLQSPASLAGDVAMTLLAALPAGPEFLQIDAAGVWSTTAATATVSLDGAYDSGGPGAGRIVLTTDGPVELQGADGLRINHSIPMIEWETDLANFNWRTAANVTADMFHIQRGEQDADISDDVFVDMLTMDGSTRRVGVNVTSIQDTLHVFEPAAVAARIRLEASSIADDVSIAFLQSGAPIWETGHDESVSGYVIGRLSFTNPALFIQLANGFVGINTVSPLSAQLEVVQNLAAINTLLDQNANAPALVIDSEATTATVLDIRPSASNVTRGAIHMDAQPIASNAPLPGDLWFDGERFGFKTGNVNQNVSLGPWGISGTPASRGISGGVIFPLREQVVLVVGEGAAPDTLNTITESPIAQTGEIIYLRGATNAITVVSGAGNIFVNAGGSRTLNSVNGRDVLTLMKIGLDWVETAFSNNV